jgi:hypothetical protein
VGKRKRLDISLTVCGQDCLSTVGTTITPAECRAIAEVFLLAATYIDARKHGTIQCEHDGEILAAVDIHGWVDADDLLELPVIATVKVK